MSKRVGTILPDVPGGNRRGSALLVTMLTAVLLSGLAGALVVVLTTEEAVEANHRRGVEALYAADGLLTGVVAELSAVPDWQVAALHVQHRSHCGTARRRVGDRSAARDAGSPAGARAGRWGGDGPELAPVRVGLVRRSGG